MRYRIAQALVLTLAFAITAPFSSGCSGSTKANSQATDNQSSSQSSNQSGQSSSQNNQSSTNQSSNGQQSLDGCLVREEHAVYLVPAAGDKTKLNSGDQDLNSHVGQQVRVTGSGNQGSSQSSQSNTSTSTQGSSSSSTANTNEFYVTRVDVLAHTCPADIQGRIDKDKKKHKSK
jgi:hypothetical protein